MNVPHFGRTARYASPQSDRKKNCALHFTCAQRIGRESVRLIRAILIESAPSRRRVARAVEKIFARRDAYRQCARHAKVRRGRAKEIASRTLDVREHRVKNPYAILIFAMS